MLTLTAHSDGGDGRIALHGCDRASVADPLGNARSHGWRLANHDISCLVRRIGRAPLPGTPVTID